MDVNIDIKVVGILAIVAIGLVLAYFSSLAGMGGWAIGFFLFALLVVLLFFATRHSGGD